MLNEIHLALSICGAFADVWAVALGKTAVERSGEMRKMRSRNAESFARKTWDECMWTLQFMEMMKAALNGARDLQCMARDGMKGKRARWKPLRASSVHIRFGRMKPLC